MDRILEQNDTLFKLFEYSAARWHGRPMASYIDGTQAYTYGSFQEKVMKMSVLLARHHVYGGKVAIRPRTARTGRWPSSPVPPWAG